jgi:hypothetical protein
MARACTVFEETHSRCPAVAGKAVFWVAWARMEEDGGEFTTAMDRLVEGSRACRESGMQGASWEHQCMTRAIKATVHRLAESAPAGANTAVRTKYTQSRVALLRAGQDDQDAASSTARQLDLGASPDRAPQASSALAPQASSAAPPAAPGALAAPGRLDTSSLDEASFGKSLPQQHLGVGDAAAVGDDSQDSDGNSLPASPGAPEGLRRSLLADTETSMDDSQEYEEPAEPAASSASAADDEVESLPRSPVSPTGLRRSTHTPRSALASSSHRKQHKSARKSVVASLDFADAALGQDETAQEARAPHDDGGDGFAGMGARSHPISRCVLGATVVWNSRRSVRVSHSTSGSEFRGP